LLVIFLKVLCHKLLLLNSYMENEILNLDFVVSELCGHLKLGYLIISDFFLMSYNLVIHHVH